MFINVILLIMISYIFFDRLFVIIYNSNSMSNLYQKYYQSHSFNIFLNIVIEIQSLLIIFKIIKSINIGENNISALILAICLVLFIIFDHFAIRYITEYNKFKKEVNGCKRNSDKINFVYDELLMNRLLLSLHIDIMEGIKLREETNPINRPIFYVDVLKQDIEFNNRI